MTVSHARTLLLCSGAVALLTILYMQQRPVDPVQHHRFTRDLLRMRHLDAELNRDLLSSRFESSGSYDSVVRKLNALRKTAADLRPIPLAVSVNRHRMEHLLDETAKTLQQKERLIELIKSDNAVLRNSVQYFPELVEQASREAGQLGDPKTASRLSDLLRDVLLFELGTHANPTPRIIQEIETILASSKGSPQLKAALENVRSHALTILRLEPSVRDTAAKLAALPVTRNLGTIGTLYNQDYDSFSRTNWAYRLILYLCSVVLLLFGANRTINLVKSRLVLEQANKQLHESNEQLLKVQAELKSANQTMEEMLGQLRVAEERYKLAVRGANDGLWDWDLTSGKLYLSPRWKEMLGFAPDELENVPGTWINRLHPKDRARVQGEWKDHFENRTPVFESEHRMLHQDGTYRWMLSRGIAVRSSDGRATRMAGSQTDITGNKSRDPLTGLANRLLFSERLSQLIREKRRGAPANYAVFFLDVDRFKIVNDSLGHIAGDSLLRQIADRLRDCVRATDLVCRPFGDATIARLGGDEFAILIENCTGVETATSMANRIVAEFAKPFHVSGRKVVSTLSVGVALGEQGYVSAEDVLRDADIAMYEAKSAGKSRAGIFHAGMRARVVRRMEMETGIRLGIERGEFFVLYQPKVELTSGRITGFEALVRWNHPKQGMISPADFIPLAEETGLIVPLGYLVLRAACMQLREWRQEPGGESLSISVNLSSRQFAETGLVDQIAGILRDSGIPAHSLDLELTETAVMEDPDTASNTLQRLKALGIGLQMDDFGTGYSSLSYLKRFPFDTIKIDRTFVSGLDSRVENRDLIRTILDLAKNFNMTVIAEGIETDAQLRELMALGCNHGQGYLFSKPVKPTVATELVRENFHAAVCCD